MGRNRRSQRRRPGAGHHHSHHSVVLNEEGVPAARPEDPRPSPVVFVTAESLERYPWLPPRVIVGSHWRGPGHEKVWIDADGNAIQRRGRAVAVQRPRVTDPDEPAGEAA